MGRRTKRWLIALVVIASSVGALYGAGRLYAAWLYPYGSSHCCDIGMGLALNNYAENNHGVFPAGEATPEASLSLLYPKYTDANELRGKTVPLDVVQAVLDKGERLGPDTCGWHYVEGLRLDDDPRLAILWDKAGLGHNGERLSGGGHIVIFLDSRREQVTADNWDTFLAEQKQLFEEAQSKRGKAAKDGSP